MYTFLHILKFVNVKCVRNAIGQLREVVDRQSALSPMPTEYTAEKNAEVVVITTPHLRFTKEFSRTQRRPSRNLKSTMSTSKKPLSSKRKDESVHDYGENSDTRLRRFYEQAKPGHPYTLKEIAEAMGVTRERVRQIEESALKNFGRRFRQLIKNENVDFEEFKR